MSPKKDGSPKSMTEVGFNILAYMAIQYFAVKLNKRKMRKLGGSEAEVYAFASQMKYAMGRQMLEQFHLTSEELTPVVNKFIESHIGDIEKFLKAHPNVAKHLIKVG